MAIPDFQTIMRPMLEHLAEVSEARNKDADEYLAARFRLSDQELEELLPSGRAPVFKNRTAWARFHLKAAGLIEAPERGLYRITDRGRQAVGDAGATINMAYLRQFEEYRAIREGRNDTEVSTTVDSSDTLTPIEHIELGYQQLRSELQAELLSKVKAAPPDFFERLVVELIVAMGYGGSRKDAGETLGRSGDGGIDGVIKEDRLGLDAIYLQAKRWEGVVGRPEIQKFAGALQGRRARKGIFLTTSSFTREAMEYAEMIETRIVLIDGKRLAGMMVDFDVGVSTEARYEVKRLDTDYFDEQGI